MKFGFNKSAGKKTVRDAVADLGDLSELLYVGRNYIDWGAPPSRVGTNFDAAQYQGSEFLRRETWSQGLTGSESRISLVSPENAAEASRSVASGLQKPLSLLTRNVDTITVELSISRPDANGKLQEQSLASLVLRLDEKYDQEKLKKGTLRGRILSYTVDGVAQDVTKPVDLKPMLDYDREMARGYFPVPKAEQPEGYVPQHRSARQAPKP